MPRPGRSSLRILMGGIVVLALVGVLAGVAGAAGVPERPAHASPPSAVGPSLVADGASPGAPAVATGNDAALEGPARADQVSNTTNGDPATDNTVTHLEVEENGAATWRVTIRTRLATDRSVAKYEAFQERFRSNRSAYLSGFREPMEGVVAAAANATGRGMAATNFTASTSIRSVPRRWGIVTYSFDWEGFARNDGENLQVGDAFESGFFLNANDTLRLYAPEGYQLADFSPPPDEQTNETATWVGRLDFGTGEPAAAIVSAPAGGSAAAPVGAAGDGGPDAGSADGGPVPDVSAGEPGGLAGPVLALLGAAALVGGGLWYRRRNADSPDAGTDRSPEADRRSPADRPGGGATANGGTDLYDGDELLTDGERVRQIVRRHGGRMKQADIVEEVEWSKSKVSRVLGDLAEDGVVEKTRIGRENVITLVDETIESRGDD